MNDVYVQLTVLLMSTAATVGAIVSFFIGFTLGDDQGDDHFKLDTREGTIACETAESIILVDIAHGDKIYCLKEKEEQ